LAEVSGDEARRSLVRLMGRSLVTQEGGELERAQMEFEIGNIRRLLDVAENPEESGGTAAAAVEGVARLAKITWRKNFSNDAKQIPW